MDWHRCFAWICLSSSYWTGLQEHGWFAWMDMLGWIYLDVFAWMDLLGWISLDGFAWMEDLDGLLGWICLDGLAWMDLLGWFCLDGFACYVV